ncbi:condensation domain-containing protein [Rhodococcus sp. USK13]|uniref:condensation domain-containing protein n=1 Tax=Rhodococcus sp. USK13 TaxID=2806442 RepID=UPI0024B48579|nr:condensation domain-containing protein [Rhodococcus sp. USK13]
MAPLPLQAGLLFHSEYTDHTLDTYTVQLTLDLHGPLDTTRLHHAAETLLHRHPNLRAAFTHTPDGHPIQIITDHTPSPGPNTTSPTNHPTNTPPPSKTSSPPTATPAST